MPGSYDAAYIGVMAYLVIANVDLCLQEFRGGNAAQRLAASMILRRPSNVLAGIARCGVAVDSLLFNGGKIGHATRRTWIWSILPGSFQYSIDIVRIFDPNPNWYTVALVSVLTGFFVGIQVRYLMMAEGKLF